LTEFDKNIFAGTWYDGIYKLSINDTIWKYVGLLDKNVTCLDINGTTIFAGTDSSGIYFSSDNGINWSEIYNGLTNKNIKCLSIRDSITFAGTKEGIFLTSNNGESWIDVSYNLINRNITSIIFSNNNIFIGIQGNGIFKTDIDELLASLGLFEHKSQIGNLILFPNPSSDYIFIKCGDGTINQNIKIYDILGNAVWQNILVGESMRIDISTFPIGVYFVRIGNETKMFVKN
jgi:hypothetical protein